MTTMTLRQHRPVNPLVFVLILATLAIPAILPTVHADLHDEAAMIRQCFNQPGKIGQIWINSSGQRLNCLVDLPTGKVGDRIIQWCKKSGWMEVTAYIIGDGTLKEAIRTLKEKACSLVYER